MNLISPSRVVGLRPFFNKEWLEESENTLGSMIEINAMNNKIFLEDKVTDFKESIHSLQGKHFFKPDDIGSHTWVKNFENGWLSIEDRTDFDNSHSKPKRYKIDRFEIDYFQPPPINSKDVIDFSEKALAVMEYISGHSKKYLVLKDGQRKLFEKRTV